MSKIFLNIPDKIESIINSYTPQHFDKVYRLITHRGPLLPTDFYPTFADHSQIERIEKARLKGTPANVIVSQVEENNISNYSLSLLLDAAVARKRLRRCSNVFLAVAYGGTSSSKGVAHQDNNCHVSYYLYDYIRLNPYTEFHIEESAENE